MTETKAERVASVQKLFRDSFDLAVRDLADKLSDGWSNGAGGDPCRPLSRAYELLDRTDIGRAVVQSCRESVRAFDPGTMSHPTDEARLAQLYCQGKLDLSELPDLHRVLNARTLAALTQGVLASRGYAAAAGTRGSIAPHRWQILQPDFKAATASLDGKMVYYDIEVEVATSAPSKPKKAKEADVKRWYAEWIRSWETKDHHPRREVDWAAAKAKFGSEHRPLLKTLRPDHWKVGGRPGARKNPAN